MSLARIILQLAVLLIINTYDGFKKDKVEPWFKFTSSAALVCGHDIKVHVTLLNVERTSTLFQSHLHYITIHPVSH